MQGRFIEESQLAMSSAPVNTTGASQTGAWISLKNYRRLVWAIMQGAWAGGTPAVTLQQATSSAGAGAKALAFTEYWQSTTSSNVYTKTAVVSNTFNLPNQANTLTLIEITEQDLDSGGFAYVQLNIASPGANADLVAVLAIPCDPTWAGLLSTHPSVLT